VRKDQQRQQQHAPVTAEAWRQEKRSQQNSRFAGRSNVIGQSPSYQEPTKTLRGALALVSRRKLLHQIPRRSVMIDDASHHRLSESQCSKQK